VSHSVEIWNKFGISSRLGQVLLIGIVQIYFEVRGDLLILK
jgi:hypothetical protein